MEFWDQVPSVSKVDYMTLYHDSMRPWGDAIDNNGNGLFDVGIDAVEEGARLINGTHIFVYADAE